MTTRFAIARAAPWTDALNGRAAPSGIILNGPTDGQPTSVPDAVRRRRSSILELVIAKGSNSGVYLQGLYDSTSSTAGDRGRSVKTSDAGAIYHRWMTNRGRRIPAARQRGTPARRVAVVQCGSGRPFDACRARRLSRRASCACSSTASSCRETSPSRPDARDLEVPEAAQNPLMIQGGSWPGRLRNVYVRPLRPLCGKRPVSGTFPATPPLIPCDAMYVGETPGKNSFGAAHWTWPSS